MFRKFIRESEELVDPDRAGKILANCAYDRQRNLARMHVRFLADMMRSGKFIPCELQLCSTRSDPDTFVLLDGQHRLAAIVECQIPQLLRFCYLQVQDMKEMGELYASIDSGRLRSLNQRIHAVKSTQAPTSDIALVGAAALFVEQGFVSAHIIRNDIKFRSPIDRVALFEEWHDEYCVIKESLAGASHGISKLFWRTAGVAVFLVASRFQAVRARELLCQIGDNDMLIKQSPSWQFINNLNTKFRGGGRGHWASYARFVATIWNAHYQGKDQIIVLNARREDLPIELMGTPFDGKTEQPDVKSPRPVLSK